MKSRKKIKSLISYLIFLFFLVTASASASDIGITFLVTLIIAAIIILIIFLISKDRSNELYKAKGELESVKLNYSSQDSVGDENNRLYFNKSKKSIMIAAFDKDKSKSVEVNEIEVTRIIKCQNNFLVVDDNSSQVLISNTNKLNIQYIKILYKDIISVEIEEDGVSVFQKSAGRTVGGALIGGVLLGGAGAIVGGLSGSSKESKRVFSIVIKLTLRDIETPIYKIVCYDGPELDVSYQNSIYKRIIPEVNQIKDVLSVIIDKNVSESVQKQGFMSQTPTSIADELEKIAILRDKGVITEEEFQNQKKKLLSN